jgi:adenylosuccinate synthase
VGLRIADLVDPVNFRPRLEAALVEKNAIIERVHGEEPLDADQQFARYAALGERLAPFVADTGAEVRAAYRAGRTVLFEGAQGVMLDLDHGTYPFVTSSSTGVDGIAAGAGFPPQQIDQAIGIAKAYCTRVGEGPFPSEDKGPDGERLREVGNEYGATTGRPRRCGWLDAVALGYAFELNGATGWIMTNLDVLSAFDEIKVATSYRLDGERLAAFPAALSDLSRVEVEYTKRPGWGADITGVRRYEDLPAEARAYVEWVEEISSVPIVMLSVGPERDQVISRGL